MGVEEALAAQGETDAELPGMEEVNHTTVTEAFDWGPAITKVVLDIGRTMVGNPVIATAAAMTTASMDFPTCILFITHFTPFFLIKIKAARGLIFCSANFSKLILL